MFLTRSVFSYSAAHVPHLPYMRIWNVNPARNINQLVCVYCLSQQWINTQAHTLGIWMPVPSPSLIIHSVDFGAHCDAIYWINVYYLCAFSMSELFAWFNSGVYLVVYTATHKCPSCLRRAIVFGCIELKALFHVIIKWLNCAILSFVYGEAL